MSEDGLHVEQVLLDSLLTTYLANDEIALTTHRFLEARSGVEVCQQILNMWTRLKPLTQKVVALTSQVKHLEKDTEGDSQRSQSRKDHLTMNLRRAEDEVNALFEENKILDHENKRLMML